ncbi:hypothetical protein ABC382_01060 [Lysinibacillus sp. 1P01SD]|uniref:hypothetical protein n=1 Tax=Lysinibacillus sp. 1P01SD TaxID=3132285 RepID=UPI0039A1F921
MKLTKFNLEKTSFYKFLYDLQSIDDLTIEKFEKMMEQDVVRIINGTKNDVEKYRFNIKHDENELLNYVKVLISKEDMTQDEISLLSFVEEINSVFLTNLKSYYNYIQSIKIDLATESKFSGIKVNPQKILEVFNTIFDALNEQLGKKMVFVVPKYDATQSEVVGMATSFSYDLVQVLQAQGEYIDAQPVIAVDAVDDEEYIDSDEVARKVISFLSENLKDKVVNQEVKELTIMCFMDVMYLMEDNTIAELANEQLVIPVGDVEKYLLQTVQQLEGLKVSINLSFTVSYDNDSNSTNEECLVCSPFMISLSSEEIQELAEEAEDEEEFVQFFLNEIDSQIEVVRSYVIQELPYLLQTIGDEALLISSVLSNFKHDDTKNMSKVFADISKASIQLLDGILNNNEGIEMIHIVEELQRISESNNFLEGIKDDNGTQDIENN